MVLKYMRIRHGRVCATLAALGLSGVALTLYLVVRAAHTNQDYDEALCGIESRDFARALVVLEEYLQLHPDDQKARLLAARTARRKGDLSTALGHLDAFQQGNGSANDLGLEKRLIRVQKGNLAEAEELLHFCLDRPDLRDSYLVLEAVIEGKLKGLEPAFGTGVRFDEGPLAHEAASTNRAIDAWMQQRSAEVDQVQGLVWRGRLHLIAQDFPKAQTFLNEALQRDPHHFDARLKLAAAIARDDPEAAASHLAKLHQREPKHNQVRFGLATLCRGLGRFDDAAALLDDMLEDHPNDVQALLERGRVALDARQPADAEQWLRRAYQIDSQSADVNLTLSRCLQLIGKVDEAKKHRDRFHELDAAQNKNKDDGVPKPSPQ